MRTLLFIHSFWLVLFLVNSSSVTGQEPFSSAGIFLDYGYSKNRPPQDFTGGVSVERESLAISTDVNLYKNLIFFGIYAQSKRYTPLNWRLPSKSYWDYGIQGRNTFKIDGPLTLSILGRLGLGEYVLLTEDHTQLESILDGVYLSAQLRVGYSITKRLSAQLGGHFSTVYLPDGPPGSDYYLLGGLHLKLGDL